MGTPNSRSSEIKSYDTRPAPHRCAGGTVYGGDVEVTSDAPISPISLHAFTLVCHKNTKQM